MAFTLHDKDIIVVTSPYKKVHCASFQHVVYGTVIQINTWYMGRLTFVHSF